MYVWLPSGLNFLSWLGANDLRIPLSVKTRSVKYGLSLTGYWVYQRQLSNTFSFAPGDSDKLQADIEPLNIMNK